MRQTAGQLLRYGVVGLFSNAVGYLLYLALTAAGMGPKLAMTLLYALGMIQTFFFNKRWSFRHGGAHGPAFVRYCTTYSIGYLINLGMLYLLVDRFHYPHWAVQGVMILLISLLLFLMQKHWVFKADADEGVGIHD